MADDANDSEILAQIHRIIVADSSTPEIAHLFEEVEAKRKVAVEKAGEAKRRLDRRFLHLRPGDLYRSYRKAR